MGGSIPKSSDVDPTWHVDIDARATQTLAPYGGREPAAAGAAANLPSRAALMQAFCDALLEATDSQDVLRRVSAVFENAAPKLAQVYLYRRISQTGPQQCIPLMHRCIGDAAVTQTGVAPLNVQTTCQQVMQTGIVQRCEADVTSSGDTLTPGDFVVVPLRTAEDDKPDGAMAFALCPAAVADVAFCALCAGLCARLARALRVHERHEHSARIQTFLNNAMEAAYAGTWHIDLRTGQTVTSPTTHLLFGEPVTNQDIFGLVNRLIHPEDRDYIRRTYYEAIRAGVPYYHEYRIIRSDGVMRWLCSHGIPVYDAENKPAYVSGIIADITARVEGRLKLENLAQTLQEAVGARDAFLARASHELKTPLTALQLLVEHQGRKLARQGMTGLTVESVAAVAKRTLAQTQRLGRLIDDMMDVSRIHAKRLALEPVPCDLSQLVADTAQDYKTRFGQSGAHLRVEVQPDVKGHWDPGRLQQVISNLLNNALRYAPGQDVALKVEADHTSARVCVDDLGPGVPVHMRETLFDSFRSGDLAGAMGGLGLGLHICKEIAHLHRGTLSYGPNTPGGSSFVLSLPKDAQALLEPA